MAYGYNNSSKRVKIVWKYNNVWEIVILTFGELTVISFWITAKNQTLIDENSLI